MTPSEKDPWLIGTYKALYYDKVTCSLVGGNTYNTMHFLKFNVQLKYDEYMY